jgi:plasmid maintenance system antidote protein VapI
MINSEAFTKRLKEIFEYYDISAAAFAEKLQIPRSSISHIISGRNKPSLDFVLKVVENFPEVELYWLLNGKGNFPKTENTDSAPTLFSSAQKKNKTIKNDIPEIVDDETKFVQTQNKNSEIERIVIFYKDGSFKNYSN